MMNDRFYAERVKEDRHDTTLLILLILIVGIGLGTLFSASYYYGGKRFDDPFYFFYRQIAFVGVGVVLAFISSRIPLQALVRKTPLLLVLTFVLLVATFIPGLKHSIMGANRWLSIGGYTFQPSELAKLTLVIYLSAILSKKGERLDDVVNSIIPPLLVVFLFTALIYLQNDFSTALFVLLVSLLLFFVAGIKFRYFMFLFSLVLPLASILVLTKEYRVRRVIAFLDPNSDPIGTGYQVIAARHALASGDFWGRGFGMGTEKFGGLPEAHSDFIFAVFAEEMGFVGVVFAVVLFLALAVRGYSLALQYEPNDRFRFMLTIGLTSCLVFQALVNMAVVVGMVPATGLPLPFFSHGGSSMVVSLIMGGLLLNLSRNAPESVRGQL